MEDLKILEIWRRYYQKLMNEESKRRKESTNGISGA